MGIFDSFIKKDNSSSKTDYTDKVEDYSVHSSTNNPNMPPKIQPQSFEDVYKLLGQLRLGNTVIVDCTKLKQTSAIRIIDILSGATYCLNGSWQSIAPEIFMFVPNNAFNKFNLS